MIVVLSVVVMILLFVFADDDSFLELGKGITFFSCYLENVNSSNSIQRLTSRY